MFTWWWSADRCSWVSFRLNKEGIWQWMWHFLLIIIASIVHKYWIKGIPREVSGRRADLRSAPAADFPRDVCLTVSRNHAVFLLYMGMSISQCLKDCHGLYNGVWTKWQTFCEYFQVPLVKEQCVLWVKLHRIMAPTITWIRNGIIYAFIRHRASTSWVVPVKGGLNPFLLRSTPHDVTRTQWVEGSFRFVVLIADQRNR